MGQAPPATPPPPTVTLVPPVAPAPAPPTVAAAPASTRTVSNWRERRPDPVAIPRTAAQVATDLDGDEEEEAVDADSAGDSSDMEAARSRRNRLIATATILAGLLVGAVVLYSTGVGDRLFAGAAKKDATHESGTGPSAAGEQGVIDLDAGGQPTDGSGSSAGTGASAGSQGTETSAGSVAPNDASKSAPKPSSGEATTGRAGAETPGATSAAAGQASRRTVYGLQVASFRTAGRSTRVLNDLESATNLPGEVLQGQTDGETWFRVVLGRFKDERTARASADDLLRRSLIAEAIIIPYDPRMP